MAETCVVNVQGNGYRNAVIRCTFVSVDGSGITAQKIYDASSSGSFGVTAPGGQIVYPGIHSKLMTLDYDVQDVKVRLQWEATANQDLLALGNAPEDFDWHRFGGLTCPPGLTGATGSILLTTVNCAPQATFSLVLGITKGVPHS